MRRSRSVWGININGLLIAKSLPTSPAIFSIATVGVHCETTVRSSAGGCGSGRQHDEWAEARRYLTIPSGLDAKALPEPRVL